MNTPVLSVPAAMLSRYCIDFKLANANGKPILFMSDAPTDKDRLELTLTNRGTAWIYFYLRYGMNAYVARPNPKNWYSPYPIEGNQINFTLSFRKGILSAKTIDLLQPGSDWHGWTTKPYAGDWLWSGLNSPITPWLIEVTETRESYVINFQCYYQQAIFSAGSQAASFDPGRSVKLVLPQFSAAAVGGDRLTQALFGFVDEANFFHSRRLPLAVMRRPQDPQIPFSVALVDTQPIVNDGVTRNTVSLQITNQLAGSLQLTPRGQAAPTTLTVSFNVSDITQDSALTDIANAGNIVCEPAAGAKWHAVDPASRQERIPEFSFTTDATSMASKEALTINLSEIVSATAAQTARITISYENLPDPKYANGQVAVTVQKVAKSSSR